MGDTRFTSVLVEKKIVAGTAYTLLYSDAGKTVVFTNGSAVTLTVPPGLDSSFTVGIVQAGAGAVTPTAGAGITIANRQSFVKTAGQYAVMLLSAIDRNSYVLSGDGST